MLCLLPTSHQPAFAQGQTGSCGLGKKAVKPLMETHTLSPYPVDSVKNDEEGTVMIEVRLGADGVPTQVNVKTSSGFPRLDEQTRKWVLDHWRWQPPGGNCSATTLVNYRWSLADADTHSPPSPQYDGNAITRALLGNH
jgi:TonB family protein